MQPNKHMSPHSTTQSKSAFTLIELLVSVAIFGILSLLIAQFLVNFMNMKFNTETRQRIRQEGNYALDRIEFLVRNSITLPDICCVNPNVTVANPCVPLGSSDTHYSNLIKLNTQGTGSNFFQRNQVKIEGSELILMIKNSIEHDSLSFWTPVSEIINLTSSKTGSAGSVSFEVKPRTLNRLFSCSNLTFQVGAPPATIQRGFIVTVAFTITYNRRTFGTDSPPIVEVFEREIAVVNTNPFEN